MKILILSVFVCASLASILTQDDVDFINSYPGNTWKASLEHRVAMMDQSELSSLFGPDNKIDVSSLNEKTFDSYTAPDSYDTREVYGDQCVSVTQIRDQSDCGTLLPNIAFIGS